MQFWICLLCATPILAENRDYWVVGSYQSEANAEAAMLQIEAALGVAPEPRITDNGLFRLVLRATEVTEAELKAADISAWGITLSTQGAVTSGGLLVLEEPSADREPSADKEPSANKEPSADKEPSATREPSADEHTASQESVPSPDAAQTATTSELPPLNPGQSLTGYCGDQTADFCGDVEKIQRRASSLETRVDSLQKFCDSETVAAAEREICQRLNR